MGGLDLVQATLLEIQREQADMRKEQRDDLRSIRDHLRELNSRTYKNEREIVELRGDIRMTDQTVRDAGTVKVPVGKIVAGTSGLLGSIGALIAWLWQQLSQ
jgi:hypothetical protein